MEGETLCASLTEHWRRVVLLEAEEVPTDSFLTACGELTKLLDVLGSLFAPVKADMRGNIDKLWKNRRAAPELSSTLQSMIRHEACTLKEAVKSTTSSTNALLWLKRALEFIQALLHKVHDGTLTMTESASRAYNETLSCYHGWIVRQLFTVGFKALSSREVFLRHLGHPPDAVLRDMDHFFQVFDPILCTLTTFYEREGLNDPTKV